MDNKYKEFFLNSKSSVIKFECLEISHPSFSQVYRRVRNDTEGLTVKYEDGNYYYHEFYPLQIRSLGNRGDLDHGFSITMGDLGEILPLEFGRVQRDDAFNEKPIVKYRAYRSDDLDNILYGPVVLEVKTFTSNLKGAAFEAKAPSLNIHRTGEIYSLSRFSMLRAFL